MIGLTAIMHERLSYIVEWVEYHRYIGFDLIRIYDNSTGDPRIGPGLSLYYDGIPKWLEVIPYAGRSKQLAAYNDSIARGGAEWMAFFDSDEFLVVMNGDVKSLIRGRSESGISICWLVFTANGEVVRKDGLQVERFLETLPATNAGSRKQIVRMSDAKHAISPHSFSYKQDNIWHTERDIARLNHYCTRSYDDFQEKLARGYPDGASPQPHLICEQGFPEATTSHDYSILDVWPSAYRRKLSRRLYG